MPSDTGTDTLADARTGKWHAYKDRPEKINMPRLNDLIDGDAQRLDTGFTFTEGPLYHPDGFYYFVDVRELKFYRIKPGEKAEAAREYRRRQRHDLRSARAAYPMRGRQPPGDALAGGRDVRVE